MLQLKRTAFFLEYEQISAHSLAYTTNNSDVPHLHQSLALLILVLSLEAIVDTLLYVLVDNNAGVNPIEKKQLIYALYSVTGG